VSIMPTSPHDQILTSSDVMKDGQEFFVAVRFDTPPPDSVLLFRRLLCRSDPIFGPKTF
jgi:hypothetical protein